MLRDTVSVTVEAPGASFLGGSCSAMAGSGRFNLSQGTGAVSIYPLPRAEVGRRSGTISRRGAQGGEQAGGALPPASAGGRQKTGGNSMIFSPQGLYLHLTETQARFLPAGRSWVYADLSSPDLLSAGARRFLADTVALDPELVLEEIATGAVSAKRAHSGGGSGAYTVKVDLTTALNTLSGPYATAFSLALGWEMGIPAPGLQWFVWRTPGSGPSGKVGGRDVFTTMRVAVGTGGSVEDVALPLPRTGLGTVSMEVRVSQAAGPVRISLPPAGSELPLASFLKVAVW